MDKLLNSSWISPFSVTCFFTGNLVCRREYLRTLCKLSTADINYELNPSLRHFLKSQLTNYHNKMTQVSSFHLITSDFGADCFPDLPNCIDQKRREVLCFRCFCYRVMLNLSQRVFLQRKEHLLTETFESTRNLMIAAANASGKTLECLEDGAVTMNCLHFISLLKHALREQVFPSNCSHRMMVYIVFRMMGVSPKDGFIGDSDMGCSLLDYLLKVNTKPTTEERFFELYQRKRRRVSSV